jgi:hypothetical protein
MLNLDPVRVDFKTPPRSNLCSIGDGSQGICKLCDAAFSVSFAYHITGLCEPCATKAGAAVVKAHTGRCDQFLDPDGYAEQQAERRREREARPPKKAIPAALKLQMLKRDGYRCKQCGSNEDLEADHVFPEVKGGPTSLDNLQTLCRPCNCRKGARHA